ncbi:cellulase [Pelomonas saccharophila]|nr:cellulase [Roseateles saccharophilus]
MLNHFTRLALLPALLALQSCSQAPVAMPSAADTTAIQLNQVGYLPGGSKWAALPAVAADSFAIVDATTGREVWRGPLQAARTWEPARQKLRLADFSALGEPGRYRLQVAGLPPSAPFVVAPDAYAALNAAALKFFYFNRASVALDAAHAGIWARPAGHADDRVLVHSSAAGPGRPEGSVISAPKGWYDAGDYNKYIVNSGISTYTLLATWEHYPAFIQTQQLNIPESGNGLPDLLNEALWNLEWMLAMQDPADGGVYHKLTDQGFDGIVLPHQARHDRYVVMKGTAATLDFAAVMAQASRLFAAFETQRPGLSARMLEASKRAWQWAQAHPDVVYRQPADIHTGGYEDQQLADEFSWAAAELFVTTRDPAYWQQFRRTAPRIEVPGWASVGALAWTSLAQYRARLSTEDRRWVETQIQTLADGFAARWQASPYRVAMQDEDFIWGSNSVALNQALMLVQGYRISGERRMLDAAQSALDFVLGRHPTGYVMVTGFGARSPLHPHHRPSGAMPQLAPVPGMIVGGPKADVGGDCPGLAYPSQAPARAYLDALCSYTTNEIAINWNAPLVYVSAALQALTPDAPHRSP